MSNYSFFRQSLTFYKPTLSLAFLGCVSAISLVQASETEFKLPKGFSKHTVIVHIPGRHKRQASSTDTASEATERSVPEKKIIDQDSLNSDQSGVDAPSDPTIPDSPKISAPPQAIEMETSAIPQNKEVRGSQLSPHLLPEEDIQKLLRQQPKTEKNQLSPPESVVTDVPISSKSDTTETAAISPTNIPPLPPQHTRHLTQKRSQSKKRTNVKSQPVKPVSLGTQGTQFFASLATPRPTFQARDDLSQPKKQVDASANTQPSAKSPRPDINPGKRQAILVQSQKKIILQAWIQGPKGQLALPKSCDTELKEILGQKKAPDWFATVCALDDILYVSIEQSKYLQKPR